MEASVASLPMLALYFMRQMVFSWAKGRIVTEPDSSEVIFCKKQSVFSFLKAGKRGATGIVRVFHIVSLVLAAPSARDQRGKEGAPFERGRARGNTKAAVIEERWDGWMEGGWKGTLGGMVGGGGGGGGG